MWTLSHSYVGFDKHATPDIGPGPWKGHFAHQWSYF